jgi:membrane protein required for colicin V production
MQLNWIDIALMLVLGLALVIGLIKGFIRQLIGIAAVIAGLVLAIVYYPYAAELYLRFISRSLLAQFLGFITILIIVMILGWVISMLLSKVIKGPLRFANHILGGALGMIKGVLICGAFIFAMFVFSIRDNALKDSVLAPYCIKMTKVAVGLIPQGLKDRFNQSYREIFRSGGKNDK